MPLPEQFVVLHRQHGECKRQLTSEGLHKTEMLHMSA